MSKRAFSWFFMLIAVVWTVIGIVLIFKAGSGAQSTVYIVGGLLLVRIELAITKLDTLLARLEVQP